MSTGHGVTVGPPATGNRRWWLQWRARRGRAATALALAAALTVTGCTPGPSQPGSAEGTPTEGTGQADTGHGDSTGPGQSGDGGTTGAEGADDQKGTSSQGGASSQDGASGQEGTSQDNPHGFSAVQFIRELNLALRQQDRAGFLAAVGAGAQDAVALWWDNMEVLGMSSGGLSVESGTLNGLQAGQSRDVTIRLGAVTAGTPQARTDTDYVSAGDYLVGASAYEVTVSVNHAGEARLTSFEPAGPATPWDEGHLTAVNTDHVLVAGLQSEKEVVQRVAEMIGEPAAWVLDQYRKGLGHDSIEHFTLFATGEQDRVTSWFQTGSVNSELAGFTVPQPRLGQAPGLDERIATADSAPWGASVVTVGPRGVESREALQSLTAHEFTHAVNFARLPIAEDRSRVVSEGWAEYQQELWDSGSFAPAGSWRDKQLRSCLDAGRGYPTDADFDVEGKQIYCGYVLSASIYAYAEAQGVDVFALSSRARSTGENLIEASGHLDSEPLSKKGWNDWVHGHFT